MRQVIIYPGEDGFWVAECPTLPGCISQGKSKEEAIGERNTEGTKIRGKQSQSVRYEAQFDGQTQV